MIAQRTVDKIFDTADIVEIISQFLTLKKSGSSFRAKSPFSNEKTPSFFVVPAKQIFKCFSTGAGGNVVTFLMQHEGWDYRQALKYLADYYNIEIKDEEDDPKQRESREKAQYFSSLNHAAQRKYTDQLVKILKDDPDSTQKYWDQVHRFSMDAITQFQIGIALDNNKFIYDLAREKGIVQDCHEAGLLTMSQGKYFDFFRERIIFPIHDANNQIVGFGARTYTDDHIKYLNTRETGLFKKDQYLYGLNFAKRSIIKGININEDQIILPSTVIITEGYTDVIALHEVDITNSVATLGTALSEKHCFALKRICKTVILMRDGDPAGVRAMERDTMILLKQGFKVELTPTPDNQDPEDLVNDLGKKTLDWIMTNKQDALSFFALKIYSAAVDAYDRAEAIDRIAAMIMCIPDTFVQEEYRKALTKDLKLKVSNLKSREENLKEKEKAKTKRFDLVYEFSNDQNLPDNVDLEEIARYRFFGKVDEEYTGYYMLNTDFTSFKKVSNFIMSPILHKYEPGENDSRIMKLENGLDEAEIIEFPSDAIISTDKLRSNLIRKGPYHFWGTKSDLDKIIARYLRDFPKGYEIKTLGWQPEGFFAYYNCVFIPEAENQKLLEYDEAGLVKISHKYYFSPAVSSIYALERKDNDAFEKDRFLTYSKAQITFSEWCNLMHVVYQEHAMAGIAFVFVSLFRDIVYRVDNNCPHLYVFGPKQSGKSKFAESVANVFFKDLKPFAMNSGTDAAFAAALDRYRNCPMIFNEFDENDVKPERFQAVKTAYDGEGRERLGGGANKNRANVQRVNCAMILLGQFLSTKDDNSVPSRSILRSFKLIYNRTNEQVDSYNRLKELEKNGLGGLITELLIYRDMVQEQYYTTFIETCRLLTNRIRDRKKQYDDRVLRNYTALVCMNKLFCDIFQMPWTHDEYLDWAEDEIINITYTMSQSDILKDFWLTIQNLYDSKKINEGLHFKIVEKSRIRVDEPDTGYLDIGATKLLYIRLSEVQKIYAKEKRTEGGIPINITSLIAYVKARSYYVGYIGSEDIKGKKYACFILKADELEINLDVAAADVPPIPYHESGYRNKGDLEDLPF